VARRVAAVWLGMMRYEATTKLRPDEVLASAEEYFAGDFGLTEERVDESAMTFVGGGGGVAVSATASNGATTVELVTREWDAQAQEFLGRLRRRRSLRTHDASANTRRRR
jgi:hypothetical protein